MENNKLINYISTLIEQVPTDWLKLTTHRLDIYDESQAKTQFLEQFEALVNADKLSTQNLESLPTAYDYIRLGHPLSSVLEWTIAKMNGLSAERVISFQSITIPLMAVLRKNLFLKKNTRVVYTDQLPSQFDFDALRKVYGYNFEVEHIDKDAALEAFDGSTVFISTHNKVGELTEHDNVDFFLSIHAPYGSILSVLGEENQTYVSEIQHVRRRETVAMTPANTFSVLQQLVGKDAHQNISDLATNKAKLRAEVKTITNTNSEALVASCGLSTQYAIVMGLIDHALETYPGKEIKIVVPPNCYGGTNDQARRVAACLENVEVMDLPVDGGNDMVNSVDRVLTTIAEMDAVPFIIAEIPTNPRVEVPVLENLRDALSKERTTPNGEKAVAPVFILDQTFCPNFHFLGENNILASVSAIAYVSGSKFPSGGKCTAGYLVANKKADNLMAKIEKHLTLCDNEATALQYEILAEQIPSMNQRIADAYVNTRAFVNFIEEVLPEAKINFVSEELAQEGFTPSVFSLDLPTKGNTAEEKESYKREMNNLLINMMITEIPNESKYCVSYGQLKGCYWTIPATSTQGTTKEADKDYIARVSLSANMDLEKHKEVFKDFVSKM
ncbi:cystathionine beta-synthase [Lishizhenia sp.]|uniref:cystathionine beta-synthase n=1 Tax=Lishizhenia sp. TaxID=2497594 RepID=UPI00299E8D81|nr:cystathionine beta-synthase [Lishizhenia sp.]MDX1445729.1 cystathionine beta-synthase [Lishizhenia sp.]